MNSRGSRASRRRRRIIQQIGWEQYNECTKKGRSVDAPAVLRELRNNLNYLSANKVYKKWQAQMELERQKRLEKMRWGVLTKLVVKAPEPRKYFSAGSDDPEKDSGRRPRRRKMAKGPGDGGQATKDRRGFR